MTRPLLLALALLLLAPAPAAAQRVMHRVRLGETLASIARHYYGDEAPARFIALANGLESKSALRAGDHLRVPTGWSFTVRRPSSIEELSKQLLGDRRRWQVLATLNKLGRKKRVKAGRVLEVPFAVPYLPSSGETYADLAKRFLGAAKHSSLIASYNFATSSRPPTGQQIEIPIIDVKIDPLRLEELTNEQLLGITTGTSGADRERRESLQEANALLRSGEYWAVPLRLVRLLGREIAADEHLGDVYKILAIAYVAVDREDLAVKTFQEALLRQPTMVLDQVSTSPKVLRAFFDAKSRLQRAAP